MKANRSFKSANMKKIKSISNMEQELEMEESRTKKIEQSAAGRSEIKREPLYKRRPFKIGN